MGTLKWNGGPGDWSDAANWTILSGTDSVPGVGDDVLIAAPTNYVVTVSGAQAAQDVTLDAAGATLNIAGTLQVGATLVGQGGTVLLPSTGVIEGGTIVQGNAAITATGGTLDGVTFQGAPPLSVSANVGPTLEIENGLKLEGPNGSGVDTIEAGLWNLNFLDTETLDNASVGIDQTTISVASGATLTLGANLSILDGSGEVAAFDGPGVIINRGTITGLLILGSGFIAQGGFDNEGTLHLKASALEVQGNLINGGLIDTSVSDGGVGVQVSGNLSGDGTFELSGEGVSATGTISGVRMTISQGADIYASEIDPGVTIGGFGSSSLIDLSGVTFDGNLNPFWSGTPAGGTLTLKDGSTTVAALHLVGIQNGATFSVEQGQGTGTEILTNNAPCFAAGTLIRTPQGDIPVERLSIGDIVLAGADARKVPIRWIGRRRVVPGRHLRPESVWPVRVAADALADGVPARPVWLSPEHAVFLHGVLVPVRHLINGATIRQVPVAEVTYWHVELPAHDLLMSDGMLSESYLDTGNRTDFENAEGAVTLHPTFAGAKSIWDRQACARQIRGGKMLAGIHRRLVARAVKLGYFYAAEGQASA